MKALKNTVMIVLVLLGLFVLISCKNDKNEVITIWAWNKNVDIMNDAINRYKEIDPTFNAKVESLSHNDIDNKFATARELRDGKLMADIVLADSHKIRGQFDSFKELFVDFHEHGVGDTEKDKIVSSIVEISVMDGKMIAMPFGIAPTVVFAYKPLWDTEDLNSIIENGWTWTDFKDYGLKIKANHGEDVFMTSFNMRNDDRVYRTMVSQKGQWLMDKELNVQVNNEISIAALTRVKDLYDSNLINHIDTGDYRVLMKNGKVAAQIQGFFLGGQLKDIAQEESGNFMMLPIPRWEEDAQGDSITGGSLLYVNNTIKASKKEKAVNFVKWVTLEEENAIKALEIGGIYPSIVSTFDSDYFKIQKMSFWESKDLL